MKKKIISMLLSATLLSSTFAIATSVPVELSTQNSAFYEQLAQHWSPVVYQDVTSLYDVRADFITNFDFDGDWRGDNNWENTFSYDLKSCIYYSVQETATHYYVGYYFFHPRDDGPVSLEKHENDLEGCLVVARKDGSEFGTFQLVETQSHGDWFQYTNDVAISDGSDNIDGSVLLDGSHVKVYVSANGIGFDAGHGVKAYYNESAEGGDGIVYKYSQGIATLPTDTSGSYTNFYDYALVSMDEWWSRREDVGGAGHMFDSYGAIHGDTYGTSKCTAPWGWDDKNDGPVFVGQNWSDPAFMVDAHLNGLGDFSHTYVYNPYFSHKVTLNNAKSLSNEDSFNDPSDIYIYVTVDGKPFIDERHWKYDQSAINVVQNILWGKNSSTFANQFSEDFNYIYVARPINSQVRLEVFDSDSSSNDDSMGYITLSPSGGTEAVLNSQFTSNSKAALSARIYTNGN